MINALRLLQLLPLGRQLNSLVNPNAPQRRVSLLGQRLVGSLLSAGLVLGSLLGFSAVAVAQEEIIEEVVVTGSRIARLDAELPVPVQVYSADYIAKSGAATLQDFLFTSSFAGPNLFNENETLSQTAGTANFDSRGFGDDYIVILLNGRRLPSDPLGGDGATNLNLIPITAVDRIEYLSTGASAIYGADAVQGVLNIITRQEFDGFASSFRIESSAEGEGTRTGFAVTGGVNSERGFATFSVDYLKQDDVDAAGLPLIGSAIAPDGTDGRSPTGLPGTFVDTANGISYPAPGCPDSSIRDAQFTANGSDCAFDFAPLYDAVPSQDRYNFLANAEYELAESFVGYGEFRFSKNVTEVRNGAAPAFFNITGAAALSGIDTQLGTNLANSSQVFILRRFVDAGPRATDNTNTAFSSVLGLRAEVMHDHELDVSLQIVESEMNRIGVGGQLSTSRVEAAVASNVFDPTQTYPSRFFSDNGLAISTQRQATGSELTLEAQLTGNLPFDFAGEHIGYAVGARVKEDSFDDLADVASTEGDVAGGASSNGNGERDIASLYGELKLNPLDKVELSLATRWDDYEWRGLNTSAGDDALTYMVGVSFRPIDPLLLRISHGSGFKAPTLGELFLGRSFGVLSAVDTTKCNASQAMAGAPARAVDPACRTIEIRSVSGGNPSLETESSENTSVGLVYSIRDNWTLAADYYHIEVEDKIDSLTVQEIVNNEARFPDLVTRVNGSLSVPGAEVRSSNQNLTEENGQGIDLSTQASWEYDLGTLSVDARLAYLISHERQLSALQPLCEDAGTTSEPDWRLNGQLGWATPKWEALLLVRYLGETEDLVGGRDTENNSCAPNPSGRVREVDDYLELGLRGTYFVSEDTEISLGVINLTDEEPPFSEVAGGGWPFFDQSLYDARGTRIYLTISHEIK